MEQKAVLLAFVAVIALIVVDYGKDFFRSGLKNLPGPPLARLSGLYRLSMVINGDSPQNYRKLHDRYGKIVRVGPKHVAVSDSSEISNIYGIGSKFFKVMVALSLKC